MTCPECDVELLSSGGEGMGTCPSCGKYYGEDADVPVKLGGLLGLLVDIAHEFIDLAMHPGSWPSEDLLRGAFLPELLAAEMSLTPEQVAWSEAGRVLCDISDDDSLSDAQADALADACKRMLVYVLGEEPP